MPSVQLNSCHCIALYTQIPTVVLHEQMRKGHKILQNKLQIFPRHTERGSQQEPSCKYHKLCMVNKA